MHLQHAKRVLRILKLDDLVRRALSIAGLSHPLKCYFVDDNRGHVDAARAVGWAKCVHFHERENLKAEKSHTERENGVVEIATLEQLRSVWPEIFVKHP